MHHFILTQVIIQHLHNLISVHTLQQNCNSSNDLKHRMNQGLLESEDVGSGWWSSLCYEVCFYPQCQNFTASFFAQKLIVVYFIFLSQKGISCFLPSFCDIRVSLVVFFKSLVYDSRASAGPNHHCCILTPLSTAELNVKKAEWELFVS